MVSGSQCSPRVERVPRTKEGKPSEIGLPLSLLHLYFHESRLWGDFRLLATQARKFRRSLVFSF